MPGKGLHSKLRQQADRSEADTGRHAHILALFAKIRLCHEICRKENEKNSQDFAKIPILKQIIRQFCPIILKFAHVKPVSAAEINQHNW